MSSIEQFYDFPRDADEQGDGFLVMTVHNALRVTFEEVPTLGAARVAVFGEISRSHRAGRAPADMRIVHESDRAWFEETAQNNYREAWGGNPRSGTLDRSRNWNDTSLFPWLHRGPRRLGSIVSF